jgi:hypothetical protein
MIQKLCMYIDSSLRDAARKKSDILLSRGYQTALDFIHATIKFPYGIPGSPVNPKWPSKRIDPLGLLSIFRDRSRLESRWIQEAFKNASRVEARVLYYPDLCITVEFDFFGKGNENILYFHGSFDFKSGKVISVSCGG